MRDFLISYVKPDRQWAEWICWHLTGAGFSAGLQLWDCGQRSTILVELRRASSKSEATVLVLSPTYLEAAAAQLGEAGDLFRLPGEDVGRLVPVRVAPFEPSVLPERLHWIDLVGMDEEPAREALIDGIRSRPEPAVGPPGFPGAAPADRPAFPVVAAGAGPPVRFVEIAVEQGDVVSFPAEVLALKYAQGFHGADQIVAERLRVGGVDRQLLRASFSETRWMETKGAIAARHVLYVGMPHIWQLGYEEIGEFGGRALAAIAEKAPRTRHVAMTIHGPGFGLDETEAALTQLAGCFDAIRTGRIPPDLERITIVEINRRRVDRLRAALEKSLLSSPDAEPSDRPGTFRVLLPASGDPAARAAQAAVATQPKPGVAADARAHVFVAMSFKKEMDDVFYYGIQRAVHACGLLCERIDQAVFTGDILDQIRQRIETAAIVVCELTGATPNVYLELGYAWGKTRPTILLVKDVGDLHFDVRQQRCLIYDSIRQLEERLTKELKDLIAREHL
jgi:hypothetical protein